MAVKVRTNKDDAIAKSLQRLKEHAQKKLEQGTYKIQYKHMSQSQKKKYDSKQGIVDAVNRDIEIKIKNELGKFTTSEYFSKNEGYLKKLWIEYRDLVNKGDGTKRHRGTGKDTVQKSAEQAFYMYVLAGQLTNFKPGDTTAAYVEGDITIQDGETNVPVQLKSSGAQFKATYKERGVKSQTMKMLKARDSKIFKDEEYWRRIYHLLAVDPTKERDIRSILEEYIKFSGATFYVFAFMEAGYSSSKFTQAYGQQSSSFFSVSVRAQDLIKFYDANKKAFMLDTASSKRSGDQIVRFDRPTALSSNRTLFQKYHKNFSIHYQNDQTFYRARKSGLSGAEISHYNSHVKNNPDFILIHKALFGDLEDPTLYYSKNY